MRGVLAYFCISSPATLLEECENSKLDTNANERRCELSTVFTIHSLWRCFSSWEGRNTRRKESFAGKWAKQEMCILNLQFIVEWEYQKRQ